MARGRFCSPSFFDDPDLARLSAHARLLFIATWQLADRVGVFEWDEARIRKYAFGYEDISMAGVSALLDELLAGGYIQCGIFQGKRWGFVPGLASNQRFHKDENPKYEAVLAGTIWTASRMGEVPAPLGHHLGTTPAPPEHHFEVVPNAPTLSLSLIPTLITESEGGEPPSGATPPPQTELTPKRMDRTTLDLHYGSYRRLLKTIRNREAPPRPTKKAGWALEAVCNSAPADVSAILEAFVRDPNPFYAKKGWPLELLETDLPEIYQRVKQPAATADLKAQREAEHEKAKQAAIEQYEREQGLRA